MKDRPICFHGCPTERELTCFAYKPDGRLCGEPAVAVDPVRGCFICHRHLDERVEELKGKEAGNATVQSTLAEELSKTARKPSNPNDDDDH